MMEEKESDFGADPVITLFASKLEIDDRDKLQISAKIEADHAAVYSFTVRHDGKNILTTKWADSRELLFTITLMGVYKVVGRAMSRDGKTVWKESDFLWYTPINCDISKTQFTENWTGQKAVMKFILNKKSTLYPGSFNVYGNRSADFFIMDFIGEAERYYKINKKQIKISRACDDIEAPKVIRRFINKIEKKLSRVFCLYEKNKLIVLAPLFRFENATEDQKGINWLLEEVYDFVRRLQKVTLLLMPNTKLGGGRNKIILSEKDEKAALEILGKLAHRQYVGELELPEIEIQLKGSCLSARMITPLENGSYWSRLDLLKDGSLYKRETNTVGGDIYEWELTESGVYLVQAHIVYYDQKAYTSSDTIFFADEAAKRKYADFCNHHIAGENLLGTGLYYTEAEPPLCDYILISLHGQEAFAEKLFREISKEHRKFLRYAVCSPGGWHTEIITDGKIAVYNNLKVLLSGNIVINDKYYDGVGNLPEKLCEDQLESAYGEYTAVYWNQKECRISCDLFSYSQVYCYRGEELELYSSNYKLLLRAAIILNLPCSMNMEKATITLSSPGFQVLMQNYSHKMDVFPLQKIPFSEDPYLCESGWSTKENKSGRIITGNEVYHEERYRRLLKRAIDEMKIVVKAYLESPQYVPVLPLTGGLDSRLLLSIITRLDMTKHVYIDCWDLDTDGGKKDWQIGTSIAKHCACFYDECSRETRPVSIYEEDARERGIQTGIYYSYFLSGKKGVLQNNRVMVLYGAGGEIACRPYIAARYYDAPKNLQADEEGLIIYMQSHMMHNLISGSKDGFSCFHKYLAEALCQIPGKSPYEKIDRHYMEFRHGVHFGKRNGFGTIVGLPMQSETLLRLHHMTFDIFHEIKLNLDLLYCSNPEVAQYPFEDEKNNIMRSKIMDELIIRDEQYQRIDTTLGTDEIRWRKARDSRQKNQKLTGSVPAALTMPLDDLFCRSSLMLLQRIIKEYPEIGQGIGSSLWYSINNRKMSLHDRQYLYNKLVSLHDQAKMLNGEKYKVIDREFVWYPGQKA